MNSASLPNASATLSGRELALKRRKAMALNGKAALTRSKAMVGKPLAAAADSLASADAKPAPQNLLTTPTHLNSESLRPGVLGQHAKASPDTARLEQSSGRRFALARRSTLAQEGKGGLKQVALAKHASVQLPIGDGPAALYQGSSGRQVALQRRVEQSKTGRVAKSSGDSSGEARRNVGRVRPKANTSSVSREKVEASPTMTSRSVIGAQVERSMKVTGKEPGFNRAVTGTQHIGAEELDNLSESRPNPALSTVAVGSTLREKKITGMEVGHFGNVNGDEAGAPRGITGTEYLFGERYDKSLTSRTESGPKKVHLTEMANVMRNSGLVIDRTAKVTGEHKGAARAISGTASIEPSDFSSLPAKAVQTHTAAGKVVTGTRFGQSEKVSGDDAGACRGITGTEYLSQEQFVSSCGTKPPVRPLKVSVMSSRGKQSVSGTEVGHSSIVTGDEPGSCQHITGSQYFNPESFGAQHVSKTTAKAPILNARPVRVRSSLQSEALARQKPIGDDNGGGLPVYKLAVDQSLTGNAVTGSYFEPTLKVTGNESGGSSYVSGSQYAGPRSLGVSKPSTVVPRYDQVRSTAVISAEAVTGDRPGAGGAAMTGDERGACKPVSGTPYIGSDNRPPSCAVSGRFLSRVTSVEAIAPSHAPLAFSIQSPARVAHDQTLSHVTGKGFGIDRITGTASKADGLITGTPEFRHQVGPRPLATEVQIASPAGKVTGEGNQAGRGVTGDAWNAMRRVTGTEDASSAMRNPTAKSTPRGTGLNAQMFRTAEKPASPVLPDSRITGSAGFSGKGASVTLSGGARG